MPNTCIIDWGLVVLAIHNQMQAIASALIDVEVGGIMPDPGISEGGTPVVQVRSAKLRITHHPRRENGSDSDQAEFQLAVVITAEPSRVRVTTAAIGIAISRVLEQLDGFTIGPSEDAGHATATQRMSLGNPQTDVDLSIGDEEDVQRATVTLDGTVIRDSGKTFITIP